MSTGSIEGGIKGAIFGAISAGIANHIGHGLNGNVFATHIAHGVSQGALGSIQGGKFKTGFWAAAISSAAGSSGILGDMSNKSSAAIARRTAIAATVGGIAAELGGGKFSNGARTAAFVHLFNAENITKNSQYNWRKIRTIVEGDNRYEFDGERFIKIKASSYAIGIDQFRYEAKGYPIELDGSIGSVMVKMNWGEYTAWGSFGYYGSVEIIDSEYNRYSTLYKDSVRWNVWIPPQAQTHGNSRGRSLTIYTSK